jgi:hypothetical protein
MTAEADSDAEVYIAKVDKFLTDIDPVRPWYIADQDTGLWAPKMPISVASAVSDAKSSGLSAHRYFDTDTLADHLNTVSYKDLHSG